MRLWRPPLLSLNKKMSDTALPESVTVQGLPFLLHGWNKEHVREAPPANPPQDDPEEQAPVFKSECYVLYPWLLGGISIKSTRIALRHGKWTLEVQEGFDVIESARSALSFWVRAAQKTNASPSPVGSDWVLSYGGYRGLFSVR